MSDLTMRSIVNDARTFVAQKQAEFKKEAIAGEDPSSYPGSEHDKPVDASAKQPDPEVKQDRAPGTSTADGAVLAEKLEAGDTTDATQPSGESVDKQPLITSDANAEPKTGSAKLANDLLSSIKAVQDAQAPVKAAAAPAVPAEAAPATAAAPAEAGKEAASIGPLELTQDVLAKVASIILNTEEGWQFTEKALTKEAGAEAARATITILQKQAEDVEKQAAFAQGELDAEQLIAGVQQKQAKDLYLKGAQDANELVMHKAALNGASEADLVKLAQVLADESIGEEMPAEGGEEGALDAMGGMPEDEEIAPEELQQALEELVAEGQIEAEDVQAIMEYISQADGAEGGMPEEAGMPAEGGEELPPELAALAGGAEAPAPEEGMDVAASAKPVAALQAKLAAAITKAKAAKA